MLVYEPSFILDNKGKPSMQLYNTQPAADKHKAGVSSFSLVLHDDHHLAYTCQLGYG